MATLAQILRWDDSRDDGGVGGEQAVVRTHMDAEQRERGSGCDPYRLRPLPNEAVYLYIKRFDNTGVVRQTDPQAGRAAWKAIGASCIAASLLVGMLLPGAYRLLAGYQLDRLKQARDQSVKELQTLDWEEARLLNIERMQELAKRKEFAPPSAEQVQFLQPKDSVASLQKP